jgi:multidrug efflux pump subunit AcrB
MVLLGVVIVLGMLVDDAVVVVEGIYYRLRHGIDVMTASIEALREVAAPVTAAVLTTMAAFGPLILLPGILGDFMRVVPTVVVIALAISLLEAFWMLPAHVIASGVSFDRPSRVHRYRERLTHWIQLRYVRLLVKALRHRWLTLLLVLSLFLGAVGTLGAGLVRMDFFAADTIRLFYVNVEMAPETPLPVTLAKVQEVEQLVRAGLRPGEERAILSYAGSMFTETEQRLGDHLGQIMVGLNPKTAELRTVEDMIEGIRQQVLAVPGPLQTSFLRLSGGPPTAKPISIKVRGDAYADIRAAADRIKTIMQDIDGIKDIEDDADKGRSELVLEFDTDSITRAGLDPTEVGRTLLLLVDGLVVTDMRDAGEKLEVRVKAVDAGYHGHTAVPHATQGRRQHCTGGPGQGQPTAGTGQHPTLQLPPCDHGRGRHRREPDRHRDRQRESAGSLAAVPCRILLDRPRLLRRTGRHPGKPGFHRDPVRVRHRGDVRHTRHPVPQLLAATDDPFDHHHGVHRRHLWPAGLR